MKKGIFGIFLIPVLITFSLFYVVAVGGWYWTGDLASKPEGVKQLHSGFTVEGCDVEEQRLLIRNTGSTKIEGTVSVYDKDSQKIGLIDFGPGLDTSEAEQFPFESSNGSLEEGSTYTLIGSELPSVQFVC